MPMRRALKRWIALLLLGALGFSQLGVALAACAMDRGSMAQAMTMPDDPCGGCGATDAQDGVTVACVAHCNSDLQLASLPVALVRDAGSAPVLLVAHLASPPGIPALRKPPPGDLPRRILLHSFLI